MAGRMELADKDSLTAIIIMLKSLQKMEDIFKIIKPKLLALKNTIPEMKTLQ